LYGTKKQLTTDRIEVELLCGDRDLTNLKMRATYTENNQTEISSILETGQRKLDISFYAKGPLRDLPAVFMIPDHVIKEYVPNSETQFFLNVDYNKEPVEWVIDMGERPA